MQQWDKIVEKAREEMKHAGTDTRTKQQRWHDALITAAGLREGVIGLEPSDPETGRIILDSMKTQPDPMVVKALLNPSAQTPQPTISDTVKLYRQDKAIKEGGKKDVDLLRIVGSLFSMKLGRFDLVVEKQPNWLWAIPEKVPGDITIDIPYMRIFFVNHKI